MIAEKKFTLAICFREIEEHRISVSAINVQKLMAELNI